MGSTDFSTYQAGADMRTAYAAAVQAARDEYGWDGYNGTISTTSGCFAVQQTPVTLKGARRIIEQWGRSDDEGEADPRFRGIQKWESCGAIPIAQEGDFAERTRVVKVGADATGWLGFDALLPLVTAKITLKPGEAITDIVADVQGFEKDKVDPPHVTKRAVTAERTSGRAVTRYHIIRGKLLGTFYGDASGYATMALARAAAKKLAADDANRGWGGTDPNDATYGVVGIQLREDRRPLDLIQSRVVKQTLRLKVTITRQARTPSAAGWMFFGWAAT